jgi:hypothetical protein
LVAHAERQIAQIRGRVFNSERIPHYEKVFSIFQPRTEWTNKGKAGVPVELGLRVVVAEDQYGFILTHQVMEQTTDDQVAVPLVEAIQARFPALRSVSLDKGFHHTDNQAALAEIVPVPVLPKKGKRNAAERAREHDSEFIHLSHRHSAVESGDQCLGDAWLEQVSRPRPRRL